MCIKKYLRIQKQIIIGIWGLTFVFKQTAIKKGIAPLLIGKNAAICFFGFLI